MISKNTIALVAFTLLLMPNSLAWAQQVTVEITGTVTSVDTPLTTEFAAGETVVFTVELDATTGFDIFGGNTTWDATRFVYSSSTPAAFTVGGDYSGVSNSGQLDFWDYRAGGFGGTEEGFRWESNTFSAPDVGGIPFAQTYIDVGFADNTYPASSASDPLDVLNLGDLSDPIPIGTYQESAISFYDGSSYSYVRFDVDAVTIRTPVQEVTVKITGTVTSVDSGLALEFAAGESVVFTAAVGATAGSDLFSASATVDGTRFTLSPSTIATFDIGGDYKGLNTVGQLDFYDKDSSGFPNTAEGFRWESNNFIAPAVNGIPFAQTYVEVELADSTFPASAISDAEDAIDLGALANPILPGTVQNSAISFNDGTYHYVRFSVDAIDITPNSSVIDIDGDGVPDTNDPCPSDPANSCDSSGSAAEETTSADGGTITTPDGALTLVVEAGDLAEDETLSVTKLVDEEVPTDVVVSDGSGQPLAVYVLEPDGTEFAQTVTLSINLNVTALSPMARSNLDIYLHEDTDGDGMLDTFMATHANCAVTENPAGTFTAMCTLELEHFSTYVVVAPLDSDGDGIFDDYNAIYDECPDIPSTGFDVDEDGCVDDIDGLAEMVSNLAMPPNEVIDATMENSLTSKLANAQKSWDKDNVCALVNQLQAFQAQVSAQTDKKISVDAASAVLEYSDSVIAFFQLLLEPNESC